MTANSTSTIEFRDPNKIALPKPGQDRKVYAEFIREMTTMGHIFDLNQGRIFWMQGAVLNMVRPTIKGNKKWGAFCKSIGMGVTTAKYRRKFAALVVEKDSYTTGWSEWLKITFPSYRKTYDETVEAKFAKYYPDDDQAPPNNNGKGGGGAATGGDDPDPPSDFCLTALVRKVASIKTTVQEWVENDIVQDVEFVNLTKRFLEIEEGITIIRDDLSRVLEKVKVMLPVEHQDKVGQPVKDAA